MMSRHLFFNAVREDLRHKSWMMVLFTLISFLAIPMVWLLIRSNMSVDWREAYYYSDEVSRREMNQVLDFCMLYLLTVGGIIAILAGLVTGLFGFRYVFHKNRVDAYHSLPVKRGTLYSVCYVDGIFVWLIPFLLCLALTMIFAGGFMGRLGGTEAVVKMCALAGKSLLVILIIFFLVYHLVLVAVMMSGNILNTIVNMLLLGFGVISVYAIWRMYFEYYMATFYNGTFSFPDEVMIYASPLFNAVYLLFSVHELEGTWSLALTVLVNILVAAVLGVCGWMIYQRRESELAEQGVRSKAVTVVLRTVAGMVAGMIGWLLFLLMTDNMGGIVGVAWKSFGAILLSVFVFGVLDVIFHMEFGAFLAHKFQMAGTVLLTLFICFAFYRDWFGYDTYLPEKEEIAQMAVFDRQFTNYYSRYREASQEILENMQFRDVEAIYAFLESAADMQSGSNENRDDGVVGYETVDAKVTLKNGRSYYRSYTVPADKEILWPLFTSREYLDAAYLIRDEDMDGLREVVLSREGQQLSIENAELVTNLVRAYHQELLEHTEEILSGEGQFLVRVRLEGVYQKNGSSERKEYILDVYSFMEHVIEVLRQAGYEEWVKPREASSVASIRLGLYTNLDGTETAEDIMAMAMEIYGVEETSETPETDKQGGIEGTNSASGETTDDVPVVIRSSENRNSPMLQITDRAEIEELLSYISYVYTGYNSGLKRQHIRVVVVDPQGNTSECYIPKGVLPMKYIRRFAEAVQAYGVQED